MPIPSELDVTKPTKQKKQTPKNQPKAGNIQARKEGKNNWYISARGCFPEQTLP